MIREIIKRDKGYVSQQPGESFFENEETGLVIRTNVEEGDDGDWSRITAWLVLSAKRAVIESKVADRY